MPSKKHSDRCAVITGIFCALGAVITGILAPMITPDTLDLDILEFSIGIRFLACAIASAIAYHIRKHLHGKAHRIGISVLSLLAYFVLRSIYYFSESNIWPEGILRWILFI
jgi:hypothetical protein